MTPAMRCLLLLVVFTGFSFSFAKAAGTNEDLNKIVNQIQQDLGGKDGANAKGDASGNPYAPSLLDQLRSAISSKNTLQIEMLLEVISPRLASGELRKQCETMVAQLRGSREAREKEALNRINAALKHAGEVVRTAKKASDLDPVVLELGRLSASANGEPMSGENEGEPPIEAGTSAAVAGALQKAGHTLSFVAAWQDYLGGAAAGNNGRAREALERLSAPEMSMVGLIPRSGIIAKLDAMQGSREDANQVPGNAEDKTPLVNPPLKLDKTKRNILFDIKKLDDLFPVIQALQAVKARGDMPGFSDSINGILKVLTPLSKAYNELKAGLPASIELSPAENGDQVAQIEITNLRSQLITMALPRYLGLPSDAKAKPGEGPYDYLHRVYSQAIAKEDYPLAERARKAQRYLLEGRISEEKPVPDRPMNLPPQLAARYGASVSPALTSVQLYTNAVNQEKAGQYMLAVLSYEKALAAGSDLVPAKKVGERLAALQSAHPDEFRQGLNLYLAPPSASMWAYPGGAPYGYGPPQPGPSRMLRIPGLGAQGQPEN